MSDPVLELLKDKGVPFTISGKDYVTKCFNVEHTDSNPSFRIDKSTGIAHCFSCGFKTNIFKFYGLLTNNVSIRVVKLKEKLKALQEAVGKIALELNVPDGLLCARRHLELLLEGRGWPGALEGWRRTLLEPVLLPILG